MKKIPHHIIILGCGRSGTSIFGELFQHLSTYSYYSEPSFEDLFSYNYAQPIAVKVPRESPNYPPTLGLSFPLDDLLRFVPKPMTIFWQVRHPLDTICSLKVGISRNWGHHPRPPDWKDWLNKPLLIQCAHHWNYINSVGYESVREKVMVTRFEEMILQTPAFVDKIVKKLQIDVNEEAPNIIAWCDRVQNTNNSKFVEAATSKPYSTTDHKVKVGRWKENLSQAEVESILPIIEKTAAQFGYSLT